MGADNDNIVSICQISLLNRHAINCCKCLETLSHGAEDSLLGLWDWNYEWSRLTEKICPSQFQGLNRRSCAFSGITTWTLKSVSIRGVQNCSERCSPVAECKLFYGQTNPRGFQGVKGLFPLKLKILFWLPITKGSRGLFMSLVHLSIYVWTVWLFLAL